MKKRFLFAGLLATASAVHAQSSVTLYGIVDATFAYVNSEATSASAKGSRVFQLSNGAQASSRWGIRIQEDLGGGLKAVATLENGFSSTAGSALQGGRLFGRQAFVGLQSPTYGQLTVGRQYEFGFWFVGDITAARTFATQWGAHVGDADNLYSTWRFNNSIKYISPNFAGLTFGAIYGFANQANTGGGTGFANNRSYSIGARYERGPLTAAVAYTELDHPAGGNSGNNSGGAVTDAVPNTSIFYLASVTKQSIVNSGLRYRFGDFSVGGIYSHVRLDYLDHTSLHLDNYELNGTWTPTPALLLGIAYIYTDGKANGGSSILNFASGNKPGWNQFEAGAVYSLSKRTSVYAAAIYQRASRDATEASLNLVGGPAGVGTARQLAVLTGLKHTF
ncbi:porin [Paraburkholderia xenovorans]|uniref:porin n=1 Tax=Paraburkholderia xenovorans TaxID=36873 RepID=UPI0015584864|nr:porin [Paraburkholderia xenovorans]